MCIRDRCACVCVNDLNCLSVRASAARELSSSCRVASTDERCNILAVLCSSLSWSLQQTLHRISFLLIPRQSKTVWNAYPHNVKLRSAITLFLNKHRAVKFACSLQFSAMADWMAWPSSLSPDWKWPTHSLLQVGLLLESKLVLHVYSVAVFELSKNKWRGGLRFLP